MAARDPTSITIHSSLHSRPSWSKKIEGLKRTLRKQQRIWISYFRKQAWRGHLYWFLCLGGGIVAREFLERRNEDVVGMVMIECVSERTNEVNPVDAPNTMAMLKGLDYFDVVGIHKRHRLTPEEWQAQMVELGDNGPQTAIERFAWPLTEQTLGKKKQFDRQILGSRPVSVIKGNAAREYRQVYEAGMAAGNGTDEQRAIVSKMLEGMPEKEEMLQREQLKLSSVSRLVQLEKPGHLVILEEPEAVAAEVKWVLETSIT